MQILDNGIFIIRYDNQCSPLLFPYRSPFRHYTIDAVKKIMFVYISVHI